LNKSDYFGFSFASYGFSKASLLPWSFYKSARTLVAICGLSALLTSNYFILLLLNKSFYFGFSSTSFGFSRVSLLPCSFYKSAITLDGIWGLSALLTANCFIFALLNTSFFLSLSWIGVASSSSSENFFFYSILDKLFLESFRPP